MFNIFRKKSNNSGDTQKLSMLQKIAMKKVMNMNQQEREKLAEDMMKPENHGKIMQAMEMMKKTGMISDAQIEEAKRKMGL